MSCFVRFAQDAPPPGPGLTSPAALGLPARGVPGLPEGLMLPRGPEGLMLPRGPEDGEDAAGTGTGVKGGGGGGKGDSLMKGFLDMVDGTKGLQPNTHKAQAYTKVPGRH